VAPDSPDLNPLGTMLEKYHEFQPKPKMADKLKAGVWSRNLVSGFWPKVGVSVKQAAGSFCIRCYRIISVTVCVVSATLTHQLRLSDLPSEILRKTLMTSDSSSSNSSGSVAS